MTTTDQIRIERWRPDPSHLAEDLGMLGDVLHACVHAGASVSFVLPFSREDALAFWHDKVLPAVRHEAAMFSSLATRSKKSWARFNSI